MIDKIINEMTMEEKSILSAEVTKMIEWYAPSTKGMSMCEKQEYFDDNGIMLCANQIDEKTTHYILVKNDEVVTGFSFKIDREEMSITIENLQRSMQDHQE